MGSGARGFPPPTLSRAVSEKDGSTQLLPPCRQVTDVPNASTISSRSPSARVGMNSRIGQSGSAPPPESTQSWRGLPDASWGMYAAISPAKLWMNTWLKSDPRFWSCTGPEGETPGPIGGKPDTEESLTTESEPESKRLS